MPHGRARESAGNGSQAGLLGWGALQRALLLANPRLHPHPRTRTRTPHPHPHPHPRPHPRRHYTEP